MEQNVLTLEQIRNIVHPLAKKYGVASVYIFGSYARGEATVESDLDFLVFGGENFRLTRIFALAEELRQAFRRDVDVFEITEINRDSEFYHRIMEERMLVA